MSDHLTILFYSPFNQRSRDTESLMIGFKKRGHRVISLSQAEGNQIHPFLANYGIETYSHIVRSRFTILRFICHILYLVQFCKRIKVDVVYSHLESANFVAAMAQYFLRCKVYVCRHHIDEAALYNFNRSAYYKLTYGLARHIVVVSAQAMKYMIDHEGVRPERIIHIRLGYDFDLYAPPDAGFIDRLRERNRGAVLLVAACRLTRFKRPELAIHVLDQAVKRGIDARLILLGQGELVQELKELATKLGLEDRFEMPGYVGNILDYFAGADFFLHPSVSESSSVVIKEAAIAGLPVIVCRGIGDFDDFMQNEVNSFVVDRDAFVEAAVGHIDAYRNNPEFRKQVASRLKSEVLNIFGIERALESYEKLTQQRA